jgi:uncharacterized protein (TIGR00730 family)
VNICVYCSSSDAVDRIYFDAAEEVGRAIAARKDVLVYGGSDVGLMGALAKSAKSGGAKVLGVMPAGIADHGIAFRGADELIVTDTVRERKAIMERRSDAFVALPGGFGTLEELLEILTLKQLHYHSKPVVLFDTGGFYQPLLALFGRLYEARFAKSETSKLYGVRSTVDGLFDYLDRYEPERVDSKWFEST